MLRWDMTSETEINGKSFKLYRPLYVPAKTNSVLNSGREIDDLSYNYLGSELFSYKIIDSNMVELIENGFDLNALKKIKIPSEEKI